MSSRNAIIEVEEGLAVILPDDALEECGITHEVDIEVVNGRIVIAPAGSGPSTPFLLGGDLAVDRGDLDWDDEMNDWDE